VRFEGIMRKIKTHKNVKESDSKPVNGCPAKTSL